MTLHELIELNGIVFGVDFPMVSLFPFGGIQDTTRICNKENIFLFTGIPNCAVIIKAFDGDDYLQYVSYFDYYLNLGDLDRYIKAEGSELVAINAPFSVYRDFITSVYFDDDFSSNLFSIKDENDTITGYVGGRLISSVNYNSMDAKMSLVRTYLLEYNQKIKMTL